MPSAAESRAAVLACALVLAACAGSGDEVLEQPIPEIAITVPTAAETFTTDQSVVQVAGTFSNASWVEVHNETTGVTLDRQGFFYLSGGWQAFPSPGLVLELGDNQVVARALSTPLDTVATDRLVITLVP